MKCEKLKGFKEIESLYPCNAKLKMEKADGTEAVVSVQFDAACSSVADDLKDAMSGRDENDWALNWYPWGDEYTVKNLKRAE